LKSFTAKLSGTKSDKRVTYLVLIFVLFATPAHSRAAAQARPSLNTVTELGKKLFEAARSDDVATLVQLLDQHASPNAREENTQRTPLFYGVERGNIKTVRLLLERGATPNAKDFWGMTPLMLAAKLNDRVRFEMVQMLVHAKADVDAESLHGDTAIQLAADAGFTDTVLFLAERGTRASVKSGLNLALLKAAQRGTLSDVITLLNHGANPNTQPRALNSSGEIVFKGDTPLIEAATHGQSRVVSALLEAGADPNLSGHRGRTALLASIQQRAEMTKLLLDRGANPNVKEDSGKTPLMHAVVSIMSETQRAETMELLIKGGADVNAKDNAGNSVAQLALASGNLAAVAILTEKGASLDAKGKSQAAAEFAARNRFPDVAKLLLDDENLNGKDKNGLTALMRVAQRGHAPMLRMLLYLGSQVNLQDHNGMTALMYAARYRYTDAVKALLAAGAFPNTTDKKGTTALIMAIPTYAVAMYPDTHRWARGSESPVTVRALLEGGAYPHSTDADGLTPLIFAAGRGQADIVKLLLAAGANPNVKGPYGISAYHVAAGEDVIEILKKARALNRQTWQMPKMSLQSINNLLLSASLYGDVNLMEVLLKEGADPNVRGGAYWTTPLLAAVGGSQHAAVETLLRHKADPNGTDTHNATPPLVAAADRATTSRDTPAAIRLVKTLLDAGANVNASDIFGITALAKASARGNAEMVRLLLARGANPNAADKAGKTPLIHFVEFAPRSAAPDVARLLIAAGADVHAKDGAGRSAIDIAISNNSTGIVALLREAK
jgi:ankyrin repeat protein